MHIPKLPKSIRKFLRKEKARIRRENFNSAEVKTKIQELVAKIMKEYNKNYERPN